MPLPESSLSIVCNAVNQFVRNSVNAAANNIAVSMGAPADVADSDDEHRLNLFFYRFEPGGFQSAAYPTDPWRVRILLRVLVKVLHSVFAILQLQWPFVGAPPALKCRSSVPIHFLHLELARNLLARSPL